MMLMGGTMRGRAELAVLWAAIVVGRGLTLAAPPGVAAPRGGAVLKASDVFAMYATSPEEYRAFAVTVVEWGGHPGSEEEIAEFGRTHVEPAHGLGLRYVGGTGMVTEFASFIQQCPEWEQARCLDVRGDAIRVPWLWDHSFQGIPAWWFCTNDARYREFLRRNVVLAARAGVDGIHIDDHLGSAAPVWLEACFCEDCVAGFRDWVREHVAPARLREAGIEAAGELDYRQFVLAWLQRNPGRRALDAPLAREYQDYQYRAAASFLAELREAAEAAAGRSLTFSANCCLPDHAHLTDYEPLTHFCGEVDHGAAGVRLSDNPGFAYKLADALARPMVATGGGGDWAFVKANNRPGLVRAWIAQAYAFGHFFMTPHRQWCYTQELGTHWYQGPAEEYGPLYHFIRDHAFLFDGYRPVRQVAVLYSQAAARAGADMPAEAASALLAANIPFSVVIAGDGSLPVRLTWEACGSFARVIVPREPRLDGEQQQVLDALRAAGRLAVWQGPQTLAELPPSWVRVEGTGSVWALPRVHEGNQAAVCHLLNRDYDPGADAPRPQGRFTLSVSVEALGGRRFRQATLYEPGQEPRPLTLHSAGDRLVVEVPGLGLWGIVQFSQP